MIVWLHVDISEVGWEMQKRGRSCDRQGKMRVISGAGRLEVQAAEAVTHDDRDGPISPALRVSKLGFQTDQETNSINNYKRLRLSSSRTLI